MASSLPAAPAAATRHFADDLRQRSDTALAALLRARPDLAAPSPSTLRSLAARASSRTSLERALARVDALTLQVLEAVLALEPVLRPVPEPPGPREVPELSEETARDRDAGAAPLAGPLSVDVVTWALGGAAEELPRVAAAVGLAVEQALLWDAGGQYGATLDLRTVPGLDELLGPNPAGLGPHLDPVPDGLPEAVGHALGSAPGRAETAVALDKLLAQAPPGARAILDALAWGPPVGVVPAAGSRPRDAVNWLVTAHLLVRSDARHVVLPRLVGLALRDGHTHREPRTLPPEPQGRAVHTTTADAEAASAALELVRRVRLLRQAWDDSPPSVLRAGGLGVRDLRRVATQLETDERATAFVVEVAALAGLVRDDGDAPPSYVPTVTDWDDLDDAARWARLVEAWLASRRAPWLVGSRDDKGALRAPLSPDLQRPWVPRLRTGVLGVLAGEPAGDIVVAPTPEAVVEVLTWRTPRSVPPASAVEGLLAEAEWLGVTGAGALSTPGRALVLSRRDGSDGSEAQVAPVTRASDQSGDGGPAGALRAVLPHEVDEILLQGDLTGIVPGRPSRDLARLLDRSTDVESRGAATTVRFSPASVTRALDQGETADGMLDELAHRSPVPVPQPLEYLIRDTARRHGAVRVGAASSYLRAADATVLAGLEHDPTLVGLNLVRLAPTVLAASVPAAALHEALRKRGLVSALEGTDGRVLVARKGVTGRAMPAPRSAAAIRMGTGSDVVGRAPDPEDLVAELRAVEDAARAGARARASAAEVARSAATSGGGAPLRGYRVVASVPRSAEPTREGPRPGALEPLPAADTPRLDRAVKPIPAIGAEALDEDSGTQHPADGLALLRDALRDGSTVIVEVAGHTGRLERRELKPLNLDGGRLRALDPDREAELTIAVHRIAAVLPTSPAP
ncbi:Helicase conserved C-terminal domain-containing protein [Promicromonospora umidemergens]|uniref:Helicase-associated domain-containing protein n=1 Tax=Promicromonospora umidemergens TaxID=629679 RepID=A0ABP8WUD3_9MICO|nr:helicase-associated domain-containing protein [Promicromonospora umidemergens]MCP2283481.1 Helicase conserved C-terminal domain-containing protein [Promicromonospora umidemergens]